MTDPLRIVLFDCDGTLVDTQAAVIGAFTAAGAAHGHAAPDPAAVRATIGMPVDRAATVLFPGLDEAGALAVAAAYKRHYDIEHAAGRTTAALYPGAADALDALEATGALLGIVTGKSRRGLAGVLETHGWSGRFVTVQTGDDPGPGKPAPDMVWRALAESGVEPAQAVVVGDTAFDMEMARAAGVARIGVGWGYHPAEALAAAGADALVERYDALPAAVARIWSRTGEVA
ncbi:MAG: HAD-IA family hydrolase [Azospirillaceae bacterium]